MVGIVKSKAFTCRMKKRLATLRLLLGVTGVSHRSHWGQEVTGVRSCLLLSHPRSHWGQVSIPFV